MAYWRKIAAGIAAVASIASFAPAAFAASEVFDFVGTSGLGAYNAVVTLDVVNGQAISGQGTITGVGLSGENVTLLTPSTPGAEQNAAGLFGYRFNDGTDIFNEDTAIPIDGQRHPVFNRRCAPPQAPMRVSPCTAPGAGTYSSFFAGSATPGSADLYGGGSTTVTETSGAPEPASWALMLVGVAAVGLGLRRSKKIFGFGDALRRLSSSALLLIR